MKTIIIAIVAVLGFASQPASAGEWVCTWISGTYGGGHFTLGGIVDNGVGGVLAANGNRMNGEPGAREWTVRYQYSTNPVQEMTATFSGTVDEPVFTLGAEVRFNRLVHSVYGPPHGLGNNTTPSISFRIRHENLSGDEVTIQFAYLDQPFGTTQPTTQPGEYGEEPPATQPINPGSTGMVRVPSAFREMPSMIRSQNEFKDIEGESFSMPITFGVPLGAYSPATTIIDFTGSMSPLVLQALDLVSVILSTLLVIACSFWVLDELKR